MRRSALTADPSLDLTLMWLLRTSGASVECWACDASPVALRVAEDSYSWSCMSCGWTSAWFLVSGREICILGGRTTVRPLRPASASAR